MIRVLVVDDSAFVRQALTRMLASDPGIEVVGSATDGASAVPTNAGQRVAGSSSRYVEA